MIIQRRLDGSVNFLRPWNDYKAGFGSSDSEFWIGNANIHALTSDGYTFLRIELMDHNGNWKYAEYGSFYIEDQNNNYKMHVSSYSGNAGDSFSYHDNMNFSTYDRDNDNSTGYNCASLRKGGWWYNECHKSNLNGQYANNRWSDGINWFAWMGFEYSLPEVRMMLRKP
ncbi:ficolin-1-like [Crassostrea virginica]